MLEFFTTLFGAIFWGTKIGSDVSKLKAFERNTKIVQQAYEAGSAQWEAKVVDSSLENSISCRLKTDISYLNATIKEMKDELKCKHITLYPKSKENAERYLLAKQGKLKSFDASCGISIIGAPLDNPHDMERWDEERAFVEWIHAEIKKHGANSTLMFRDTGRIPYEEVRASEMERFTGGQFYWGAAAYSTYQKLLSPYSNK